MAERVRERVRDITNDEGNRLLRIVRRSTTGSVVTWRRAHMVLLSPQGMDTTRIARVAFTRADRVRDVIHNFNGRWSTTSLTKGCAGSCASRASPFQSVKTWKTSTDPDYEAKKNGGLALYKIAYGKRAPEPEDPSVVICMDEFVPLNRQPHPGSGGRRPPSVAAPRRRPDTDADGRRTTARTARGT